MKKFSQPFFERFLLKKILKMSITQYFETTFNKLQKNFIEIGLYIFYLFV